MPKLATILLGAILVVIIVPPGDGAYVGSYAAMVLSIGAFAVYGWRERAVLLMPSVAAILLALGMLALTVPFVYKSAEDLMAPVLLLPMLCAIALAVLAGPGRSIPSVSLFAALCLIGVAWAFVAGGYDSLVLGIYRPGLGNNPIHYGSLAAIAGGMAVVGVVASQSPWRYLFLLGPVFGIGAAAFSGSRGPLLAALVMACVSGPFLITWFWREPVFRLAAIASGVVVVVCAAVLILTGNPRALGLFDSAINIFRFTGGSDDIRAGLYISSVHAFTASPIYGHGFGSLMDTVRTMFPELEGVNRLEHLHADWADFAVMSGSFGLIAYLALLASPLLILIDPVARADRPLLLGVVVLVVGQIVLGTSNAVFGVLPQTVMYGVMAGYLIARARELKAVSAGITG